MVVKKTKIVKLTPKKLSVSFSNSTPKSIDYEKDFSKWAKAQAKFLKKKEFSKLDIDHLIEEIEDLSKRERDKLISHLENVLMHMLKIKFQKEKHTRSWDLSAKASSLKAQQVLSQNPSLKPKLKQILDEAYSFAVLKAALETDLDESTFPKKAPWSLKDLFPNLENKYL